MACCILIMVWVKDEIGTNRFHEKTDSLDVVRTTQRYGSETVTGTGSVPTLAANLVAAPVSYILMKSWLREFAYRIPLGRGTFAGAAAATLAIVQLTVIGQAVRSALTSPAETIRWE